MSYVYFEVFVLIHESLTCYKTEGRQPMYLYVLDFRYLLGCIYSYSLLS